MTRPPADVPLAELARHIVEQHHALVRAQLPALREAVVHALRVDSALHTGLRRSTERLLQQFCVETENHLRKEEAVLFPLIAQLEAAVAAGGPPPRYAFGSLQHLIGIMAEEHRLTDHQLHRLCDAVEHGCRQQADIWAEPRRLLTEVVADMRVHTRIEDDILFARTICLESDR